jgi:hypothetical protein
MGWKDLSEQLIDLSLNDRRSWALRTTLGWAIGTCR